MKLKELKNYIKIGSVLREGTDHFITVTRIYGEKSDNPSYEYWENGYYHETNLEYITGMVKGQKDESGDWFVEVTYPSLNTLKSTEPSGIEEERVYLEELRNEK